MNYKAKALLFLFGTIVGGTAYYFYCPKSSFVALKNSTNVEGQTSSSIRTPYEKLIQFWTKKIEADPHSAVSRIKVASLKMSLARATGDESLYGEAEKLLTEAKKLAPHRELEISKLLASAFMSRHGFADSLELLKPFREKNPEDAELLQVEGDALLGLGKYDEALGNFSKLAKLSPTFSSWVRLAGIKDLMGEKSEAISLLEKAKDSYSKNLGPEPASWIRLRIGITYLNYGELDKAEAGFKEALQISPDYYLAQEHLAEVCEKRGEFAKAQPLLTDAIKTKHAPELILRLATVEEKLGNKEKSEDLRAQAFSMLDGLVDSCYSCYSREVAKILLDNNMDYEKALVLAQKDFDVRPGDIETNFILAKAFRLNNNFEKARFYIQQALRINSPRADFHIEAAKIFNALNDSDKAAAHLSLAKKINPALVDSLSI